MVQKCSECESDFPFFLVLACTCAIERGQARHALLSLGISSISSSNVNTESLLIVFVHIGSPPKKQRNLRYRFWWGFPTMHQEERASAITSISISSFLSCSTWLHQRIQGALSLFLRHKGRWETRGLPDLQRLLDSAAAISIPRKRALGSCYRCQRKFNKHLCQVLKWGYL